MAKVPPEVVIEQYALRASFFANQLIKNGYFKLFDQAFATIDALSASLDWGDMKVLNIEVATAERLAKGKNQLGQFYCHPAILVANPSVLRYYRCIAAFSQKGLSSITGVSNIDAIEKGKACSSARAILLAQAINTNLDLIYLAIGSSEEHRRGLMYATAGTTIDGSWRNAIGAEGERVVKTMLLRFLHAKGELTAVISKTGETIGIEHIAGEWLEENTGDLQTAICKNGSQLKFGSEPDLMCVRADGTTSAGIEVKAGLDPAGALERLGAMLKSFEHVLAHEPDAETILIASCITPEVQKRLNATRSVSRTFILTEVMNDKDGQGTVFCNLIRGCLGLVAKRL